MTVAAQAAALLGEELASSTPLQGGDLSKVIRLRLASGRSAVAKVGPAVAVEARMLRAIRATGAPVPDVLAAAGDLMVLEDLGVDDGPSGAWESLGQALARLHAATGTHYGWTEDYRFGPLPIANAPSGSWPQFWAERRLVPFLPRLPADLARRVERLAARLPGLLPATPRPALLHGDLWSGNVMARGSTVTGLIDPACYWGHTEVDLAMLALFGSPGPEFHATYGPPEPGEDARRPVYQLWPALVHLALFGSGYRPLVERLLAACD